MPKEEEVRGSKDGINYHVSKFIDDHRVGIGVAIIGACAVIGAAFGGVGALPGAGIGATIAGFALNASRNTVQNVESQTPVNKGSDEEKSLPLSAQKSRTAATATQDPHNHHAADALAQADNAHANESSRSA